MAIFFAVLFAAGKMAYDWFNPFEFFHWSHLGSAAVWGPMAAVVAASLFVYRPFCAMVCPIGLVTWLVERVSLGRIRVGSACNDCGICVAKTDCQAMPALVARKAIVPDCHGCGDCLGTCPKDALGFGWSRRD
jgi:polyferredoxin